MCCVSYFLLYLTRFILNVHFLCYSISISISIYVNSEKSFKFRMYLDKWYDHMIMENFIGFRKIELLSVFCSINILAHFTNQVDTFSFIAVIISIFMRLLNCTRNLAQDTFSIFPLPTIIFVHKIYLYIEKFSLFISSIFI